MLVIHLKDGARQITGVPNVGAGRPEPARPAARARNGPCARRAAGARSCPA
jgi:hypothetical protein